MCVRMWVYARTGKECVFDVALLLDALAPVNQLLQDQNFRFGYFLLILSTDEVEAQTGGRRGEERMVGSGWGVVSRTR